MTEISNSGAGTSYISGLPSGFSCVGIASSFVSRVLFGISLFVLFWPLYCLAFLDFRLLITPLVS